MGKRSFVINCNNKFKISWRETTSILANELLLREVIHTASYAKGKLLDVGCGEKPYLPIFSPRVKSYIGLDLPSTTHNHTNIEVFGDACSLPFPSNTFDTLLCTEVLEHIRNPEQAIKEFYRVLKNDGKLILSAPQTYQLHGDPYDFYRFTKDGLIELLGKWPGFQIKYINPIGGTMDFAIDFFSKVLLLIRYKKFIPTSLLKLIVAIPQWFYLLIRRNKIGSEYFTLGHLVVASKK